MSDPIETDTPWTYDTQALAWSRCHGLTVLVVALDAEGAVRRVEATRKARTETASAMWVPTAWMDADAAKVRADALAHAMTPVPVAAPVVAELAPPADAAMPVEAIAPAVPPVAPGTRRRTP